MISIEATIIIALSMLLLGVIMGVVLVRPRK